MLKQKFRSWGLLTVLALMLSVASVGHAVAQQSSSTHYMVTETQFGPGSSLQECSTNYCAKTSAGDTAAGQTTSTNYTARAGFITSDAPLLEVTTTAGTSDMGVLDTNLTGTATAQVKVRNYMSSGYIIQLTGPAPNQGLHTLTALTTPSTSHQGAEQFGVNLVANTSPSVGSNPVQVPDSSFSFGVVESDYATSNLFKYVDGDVVARSLSSTGQTEYTLSMIINVSNVTPGGHYSGGFSAVVVPIY